MPRQFLQAMVTDIPLGGTYFGKVTEAHIPLDFSAETVAQNGIPTGNGTVASTANIVLQDSPLSDYNFVNETPYEDALTLLHELGHVFNIVSSLGGSSIINDRNADGSVNDAAEAQNARTLEKCKPSLP